METALNYIITEVRKIPRKIIASRLCVTESEVSNFCKGKRGIADETHIRRLEALLSFPCYYWLEEKPQVAGKQIRTRYAKELNDTTREQIADYLSNELFERGKIIETETGMYNPFVDDTICIDTDIVIRKVEQEIHGCIYSSSNIPAQNADFYSNALIALEIVQKIKKMGLENANALLNEYVVKNADAGDMIDIEEYESLFGKIEKDTSE